MKSLARRDFEQILGVEEPEDLVDVLPINRDAAVTAGDDDALDLRRSAR